MDALPDAACPKGRAVAMVSMHPKYIARSWFPSKLFSEVSLDAIGSRTRVINSAKTIEFYMDGDRHRFREWLNNIRETQTDELLRIDDIRLLPDIENRIRIDPAPIGDSLYVEAALHLGNQDEDAILNSFSEYLLDLGGGVEIENALDVPGMIFVPIKLPRARMVDVGHFAYLRTLRPLAKLRPLPVASLLRATTPFKIASDLPINPAMRVAVLDGGLPEQHGLPGVQRYDAIGIGDPVPAAQEHGLAVTATLLWGLLDKYKPLPKPYCSIDHYRIIDELDVRNDRDDYLAYPILKRIKTIVETGSYDIVNLSLGPNYPLDDGEIHPWTSVLDTLAANGRILFCVAAGNNGNDVAPLNRVLVPADGVNCLAVGAANCRGHDWKRADYSAKGYGRSPGKIKPDILAFGGSAKDPMQVLSLRMGSHSLEESMGTSYAAPLATRVATGTRAFLGSQLSPLQLKALLIHHANPLEHDEREVGWGRLAHNAEEEIILCQPGRAHILYHENLIPRKWRRIPIPVPSNLEGMIQISVTLCYATEVSAADPVNYTNGGLVIRFRPNANRFDKDEETGENKEHAKTRPFFGVGRAASESELRTGNAKWETVLHDSDNIRGSGLCRPCFDIHYIPRLGGKNHPNPKPIPYAMVVTLSSKNHPELCERVIAEYPKLQEMVPVSLPPLTPFTLTSD